MTYRLFLSGAAVAALTVASPALAERGADGQLNVLYWQAPSTLNPYLTSGNKDVHAASVVLEPLATINSSGELIPLLATEVPSPENGGISDDMKTVTWNLRDDVVWSDGTPFTSADVKFTAEYCMHPEGGCAQLARFEGVESVEAPDDQTVVIRFTEPRPYPFTAFTGSESPIIQKAQFEDCLGARASSCTDQNFGPIGTGGFVVESFKTNDVVTYQANENFRDPNLPHFQTVLLKGGGDSAAAARSVLETGEYDYAWNIQLAPEVLASMADGGRGDVLTGFGTQIEHIVTNMTDPSSSLPEGERATVQHPHPFLTDFRVRKALSMAIDRELLNEIGYGETGKATCNYINAPELYASDNNECMVQDIEGARALLDEAGWEVGPDGVRVKDDMRLSLLFQTSINAVRQDFQALIKQWWEEIGVETELKAVDSSVFFGGDAGSPDTYQKFYADVEMYTATYDGTDPETSLAQRTCAKIPSPEKQWQGENMGRFCDPAYDELVKELGRTADLAERGRIAIQLNDMLTRDSMHLLPLVYRSSVSVKAKSLDIIENVNAWNSELWNIAEWKRAE